MTSEDGTPASVEQSETVVVINESEDVFVIKELSDVDDFTISESNEPVTQVVEEITIEESTTVIKVATEEKIVRKHNHHTSTQSIPHRPFMRLQSIISGV